MKNALMLLSYTHFSFHFCTNVLVFCSSGLITPPQKYISDKLTFRCSCLVPQCAEIRMEACINSYGSPHKFAWRATKIYMDVHENSEKKHVNSQRSQHESKWNSRSIHMDVHMNPHGIHIHQNGLSNKFT